MRHLAAETLITIVITIAVIVVGTNLAPPSAVAPAGPTLEGVVCEQEPVVAVGDMATQGLSQLCVTEEWIQARVELDGLQSGALYTGWMIFGDRPFASQGFPCGGSNKNTDRQRHRPVRIDGVTADRSGHALLMARYPGILLTGSTDLWMLVIRHDAMSPDDPRGRVWQPGWWSDQAVAAQGTFVNGRLSGCGHIQRRGGVESLELP